jgi:2-(1,2-epoxy-1,2-dihydrophenyl)acetyl-CoA isomerase
MLVSGGLALGKRIFAKTMDRDTAAQAGFTIMTDVSPDTPEAAQWLNIRVERVGAVQLIVYDRPARRNAWSVACVRETIAAIKAANADGSVGAIVLTGAGSIYCAGADLKGEAEYDADNGRRLTPASFTMGTGDANWIDLLVRSKPVVAAINGPAIGIGATHPLACDIRVMAESAHFSFPFLQLGAMPECGSSALLPRLIGAGRATDILLRSEVVSAQEALQWGLVTRVFADEDLREGAIAIAQQLAQVSPLQMTLTKQMLASNAETGDAHEIMRTESRAFVQMLKAMKQEKPIR